MKRPGLADESRDELGLGPLGGESCPTCGAPSPLTWSIDTLDAMRRTYRCTRCRRIWSVDGAQLDLLTDEDEAPSLLRLEDSSL